MADATQSPIPVTVLEENKSSTFNVNVTMRFYLKTKGGTTIEGWIPANAGMTIFSGGDIEKFDLIYPDQPSGLTAVPND